MSEPNERDQEIKKEIDLAFYRRETYDEMSQSEVLDIIAAYREEIEARLAPAPAQARPCDGCGNSYEGHYVDTPGSPCVNCHDGSNRRNTPAQVREDEAPIYDIEIAKEQLADALIGERPGDGFPARIPNNERASLYKSSIMYLDRALDALRARLASLAADLKWWQDHCKDWEESRDSEMDRADAAEARLASAQSSAQGEEARETREGRS